MSDPGSNPLQGFAFRRPPSDLDRWERELAAGGGAHAARGPGFSSGAAAAHVAIDGPLTVAFRGGPFWFPGTSGEASAESILAAFREKGAGLLDTLHGPFALAIVDARNESVLLAIDRMGIESLAWATEGEGIVFGSSSARVARLAGRSDQLDAQAIYDYLMEFVIPSPRTVHAGVRKLDPATCLTWSKSGVTERLYWKPVFVEDAEGDATALERDLHASLRAAVEQARPGATTGAFLSGGIDSTTVAALLGKVSNRAARTVTVGFDVADFDEKHYSRTAARVFGFDAIEYDITPQDVLDVVPLIARAFDEPFGNSSAVPVWFCAKVAVEHGLDHLLAGDGGDELFGGNERYARQQVFEPYRKLPAPLRRMVIEPLARLVPQDSPISPLRKARNFVEQGRRSLPERLVYWNRMFRADTGTLLDPEFRSRIDPGAVLRHSVATYESIPARSFLNRMLAYDWRLTLADNDLRKVNTMCSAFGVRVSYPMLDPRVVDLSLRVPPALKMRGTELRSFYKHAMRDFLPREILDKTKQGMGLPFGEWLRQDARLAALIESALADLKSRRIVRAEFLDGLIRLHREGGVGDATDSGYPIWVLAMLETWLQAHAPKFAKR